MKKNLSKKPVQLLKTRRGATMVEYGLMLALILVASFGAFRFIGQNVTTAANDTQHAFDKKN